MSNVVSLTKEQILPLLNQHLKNHPEYFDGMSFDDLDVVNGVFVPKAHFFLDADGCPTEKTEIAQKVYNEVFADFLPQ
ncbi:DUF2498 family protein [Vibrio sp. VGrn 2]|uniref:DUF2498 family protein n=1 Tax=Vibrio sp. VGrn 2 TaxID=2419839 RepID=UPI00128BACE6|nr:DUF2498 family protein [Vibrio sp. VGrn 2]MPS41763.1 DUF2498 family protein [Vibrio sp. VGrn 2]